ncbi:fibronectin-like [Branchiostoma floridae x Branchiostoma belcheri]
MGPSRPGDFNVSDVTEHTISLNWTASIGDVVEYRVNCVPADGEGKRYWKRLPWDSLNHTCTGLDSGVMYNVSVAAGTALRMGRPARDTAITLLAPPTDLKVIKATTSTLTLNWTAGTPASRLHFYTVQVCFLPPSTQTCPYVEENAENNATQLEIKELQPTSGYNISLVASGYYEDSDPIKIQGATCK